MCVCVGGVWLIGPHCCPPPESMCVCVGVRLSLCVSVWRGAECVCVLGVQLIGPHCCPPP